MLKRLLLILIAITLTTCSTQVNVIAPTPPAQQQQYYDSVGRLSADVLTGKEQITATGWAISNNILITAGHFCNFIQMNGDNLKPGVRLEVYAPNKQMMIDAGNIKIVSQDPINDICIMYKSDHGLKPLKLVDNFNDIKPRNKVSVIGAPLGINGLTRFDGEIIDKHYFVSNKHADVILLNLVSFGGNSGSPLICDGGLVCGMLIAGYNDRITIGVNAEYIRFFLQLSSSRFYTLGHSGG